MSSSIYQPCFFYPYNKVVPKPSPSTVKPVWSFPKHDTISIFPHKFPFECYQLCLNIFQENIHLYDLFSFQYFKHQKDAAFTEKGKPDCDTNIKLNLYNFVFPLNDIQKTSSSPELHTFLYIVLHSHRFNVSYIICDHQMYVLTLLLTTRNP